MRRASPPLSILTTHVALSVFPPLQKHASLPPNLLTCTHRKVGRKPWCAAVAGRPWHAPSQCVSRNRAKRCPWYCHIVELQQGTWKWLRTRCKRRRPPTLQLAPL